jgi:hydroxyquinol 1,2-dioxygenase
VSATEPLADAVAASFAGAADPRLREVMGALVHHLHAFVAETGLTEQEWFTAVDFLTRAGQASDDRRQEVVLLSDVLGVSMAVVGVNHPREPGATESTVFGPFFVDGAPEVENGGDLANGAEGAPCFVAGRVLDTAGAPVGGARVDVWQADADGLYDVQRDGLDHAEDRGWLRTAPDGQFSFRSVLPVAYPIPTDGPVGELLAAGGRESMRPAHIHFRVVADGFRTLTTHVFVAGDEHLDSDAVFGVKPSLIAPFTRHDPGAAPDGRVMAEPFWTVTYDLVLARS